MRYGEPLLCEKLINARAMINQLGCEFELGCEFGKGLSAVMPASPASLNSHFAFAAKLSAFLSFPPPFYSLCTLCGLQLSCAALSRARGRGPGLTEGWVA